MNKVIKKLFEHAGGRVEVGTNGNEFTYTEDLDPEFYA